MDTKPIQSETNPVVRAPARHNTEPQGNRVPSANAPKPVASPESQSDTVSLSQEGQNAVATSGKEIGNESRMKKFTVNDQNQVIIKVIDRETRETIKQLPSEDELRLKDAMRRIVEDL